jgi:hypothetical protein
VDHGIIAAVSQVYNCPSVADARGRDEGGVSNLEELDLSPDACVQLWRQIGVRTIGAPAIGRGNGLIDLRSPDAGHEHSMRARLEDGRRCGTADIKNRPLFSCTKGG